MSSHLHFDHCGGHVEVPNARLLVQRPEWEAGHNARLIEFGVYDPADFDIGHDVELLEGEHDIFGDGTLRVVVTPGHTSGHQSLVVEGETILVGDACYCRLALDLDALPSLLLRRRSAAADVHVAARARGVGRAARVLARPRPVGVAHRRRPLTVCSRNHV